MNPGQASNPSASGYYDPNYTSAHPPAATYAGQPSMPPAHSGAPSASLSKPSEWNDPPMFDQASATMPKSRRAYHQVSQPVSGQNGGLNSVPTMATLPTGYPQHPLQQQQQQQPHMTAGTPRYSPVMSGYPAPAMAQPYSPNHPSQQAQQPHGQPLSYAPSSMSAGYPSAPSHQPPLPSPTYGGQPSVPSGYPSSMAPTYASPPVSHAAAAATAVAAAAAPGYPPQPSSYQPANAPSGMLGHVQAAFSSMSMSSQPQPQAQPPQPAMQAHPQQQQPMGPTVAIVPLTVPPEPLAYYVPPQPRIQPTSAPRYHRSTLQVVPQTQALLTKSKLPLGIIVTPYPKFEQIVPTVAGPIIRCRRCRTYLNPFVEWLDNGAKFRCNLCFIVNEVPPEYDYDPAIQQHIDRKSHSELSHAVVEFIAPTEYMVRPPQPNVYIFVMDVSFASIQSGMVATAARVIADSLDSIPNSNNRTKIGFITFDKALHFYNFNPALSEPQQLVVSELDEVYLPKPDDLLANLVESRALIESFLKKLPTLFSATQIPHSALGQALQSAMKMMSSIGGKIVVLQTAMPNLGTGALKPREEVSHLGTTKENLLLASDDRFYKTLVTECSRDQICVDLFLFPSTYVDLAALCSVSKFTGGKVFYYPAFNVNKTEDAMKFANDFSKFLAQKVGLEAVLRIRASKGLTVNTYHGSFFTRSTDLLALANVNPDHSYAVDLGIEESLNYQTACVQTALLHTNCHGERRIRVITLALPVTNNLTELYAQADACAIANLLSKTAVDLVYSSKLESARDFLFSRCVDLMMAQRSILTGNQASPHLLSSEPLKSLPVLVLGMLKSVAFRGGARTPSDFRTFYLTLLKTLSTESTTLLFYPNMYNLHELPDQCGVPDSDGQVILPYALSLSSERLDRHGLYLLDDGQSLFLWMGPSFSPHLCQMLFGHPHPERIAPGKVTLPDLENDYSIRVRAMIEHMAARHMTCPYIYIVKDEGDLGLKMQFLSNLIEDRTESSPSYGQWLGQIREKVMSSTSN